MSDRITISADGLSATIEPLGAELVSLTDADGREYMNDGNPAFWTGRAPLLFPIVGALRDGGYRLDGRDYALPRHGFARTSRFETIDVGPEAATFRLTDSAATREAYPFAFALEMDFRLSGPTLFTLATVINTGDNPLPFSFGYHPAFAWPLPGGAAKGDHRVTFAEPEPQPVRRIDPPTGLLLPEAFPTPVDGRTLTPTAALFEPDALIWDDVTSREVMFGTDDGARLDIRFPDTPMLGIWQKPGAPFLCIEPWQGHADPVGFDGDFRDKPGIVMLPPGEQRSFRMDVTLHPG